MLLGNLFTYACVGDEVLEKGHWRVVKDQTALQGRALEQCSTEPADDYWPIAMYMPVCCKDLDMGVRFKIIEGTTKRAGLLFRLVDRSNFYLVTASALEERIDFYRVVNSKMNRLWAMEASILAGNWHTLAVNVEADHTTMSLDGRSMATVWDRRFVHKGRIGLSGPRKTI